MQARNGAHPHAVFAARPCRSRGEDAPSRWLVLGICWSLALAGCSQGPKQGASSPPPGPQKIELALGVRYDFVTPVVTGGDRCQVVCDRSGQVWVVLTRTEEGLLYGRTGGGKAGPLSAVPVPGWKFINNVKAALDGSGNPVVIWSGFDETHGEALAAIRWNGTNWTEPQVLDRLETSTFIGNIDAILDAAGSLHVVYDRPLVPRETYSRGFIIVDGEFPDKCFHLVHDGQGWTKPQPTTGKGRFYVSDLKLSRGRDGQVCLAALIGPFGMSFENSYVGYQVWEKGKWSSFRRATPADRKAVFGSLVCDGWDARHVWWQESIAGDWQYSRMAQDQTAPVSSPLYPYNHMFEQTPAGMIAVCSGEQLTVWNGREWTKPSPAGMPAEMFARPDGLVSGPDGRLFVWVQGSQNVWVQETLVRRAPSAPTTR